MNHFHLYTILGLFSILAKPEIAYLQGDDAILKIMKNFSNDEGYCSTLSSLPSHNELKSCQKRNRSYEWKRTKGCKIIIKQLETELKEKLDSYAAYEPCKALVYKDLFRIGNYFRSPDLSLIVASTSSYYQRIKTLHVPEMTYPYDSFRRLYLQETIWAIWGYMEWRHSMEWQAVKEKYYLPYVYTGATCGNGTEWIEPNYHVHLAILMHQKGYYDLASEFLCYYGLSVGRSSIQENIINTTELRQQTFYAKSMIQLYEREQLETMKSETLDNVHIYRSKYDTFAYCYFNLHPIKIHLRLNRQEAATKSDEELVTIAKERLRESVIYRIMK